MRAGLARRTASRETSTHCHEHGPRGTSSASSRRGPHRSAVGGRGGRGLLRTRVDGTWRRACRPSARATRRAFRLRAVRGRRPCVGRPPSPSKEGGEGGEGREGEAPTRSAADAGGDAEPRVSDANSAANIARQQPCSAHERKEARGASHLTRAPSACVGIHGLVACSVESWGACKALALFLGSPIIQYL